MLSAVPVHAQNSDKMDFFIGPLTEILGFSRKGPSLGAGFALGAGTGVTLGLRMLYSIDLDSINTLEMSGFFRFYLKGGDAHTGLFIQLNVGAAIFAYERVVFTRAESSALSAGVAAGWRFMLKERWYFEPYIRAGYPYIAGVGAAFAYRL